MMKRRIEPGPRPDVPGADRPVAELSEQDGREVEPLREWLRAMRKRSGRTQAVTAQIAGISREWLSTIESGREAPPVTRSLRKLVWLADALQVSRAELLLRALAEYERMEETHQRVTTF
ncbi:MAG TPA: helix-turn-helix transcriptional regulator [Pseudonocardiaceae bacterium]|jgi:predicted transcriptional regulator